MRVTLQFHPDWPFGDGLVIESLARDRRYRSQRRPGHRRGTGGPDYRGPEHVTLASSLGDVLTPDLIGVAARSGDHDLQDLKRVWHLLARFCREPSGRLT